MLFDLLLLNSFKKSIKSHEFNRFNGLILFVEKLVLSVHSHYLMNWVREEVKAGKTRSIGFVENVGICLFYLG